MVPLINVALVCLCPPWWKVASHYFLLCASQSLVHFLISIYSSSFACSCMPHVSHILARVSPSWCSHCYHVHVVLYVMSHVLTQSSQHLDHVRCMRPKPNDLAISNHAPGLLLLQYSLHWTHANIRTQTLCVVRLFCKPWAFSKISVSSSMGMCCNIYLVLSLSAASLTRNPLIYVCSRTCSASCSASISSSSAWPCARRDPAPDWVCRAEKTCHHQVGVMTEVLLLPVAL
jgi:hypothetical protein